MKKQKKTPLRVGHSLKAIDSERLQRLRIKGLDISQVELAARAGVSLTALQRAEQGGNIIKQSADAIEQTLAKLLHKSSLRLFERASHPARRLPGSTRISSVELPVPADSTRSYPRLHGFTFVLDGFIANMAAELIFEDVQTSLIRGQCPLLYEYCLRDLTFALVYASYVATSVDFRPSLTKPDQPGRELFTRLGGICKHHPLDDDLKNGALLSRKRPEISADMQRLGMCLADPKMVPLFREYMKREAAIHLGTDASLFKEGLNPDGYKFDVKRDYYKDRVLQNALPKQATDALASFLPEQVDGERYARDARVQFVTQNALSLITIMWEYDVSAERNRLWRLSHILRSLVKQKSRDRALTQHQEELRELVVRNALYPALMHTERRSRHVIVSRLMDVRDNPNFRRVREVLEREHLLFLDPDPAKEKQAHKVLRYIKGLTYHASNTDIFLFQRRSALRKLDAIHAPEFEEQLQRVFPELRPAHY